jgi:hypothetical protein
MIAVDELREVIEVALYTGKLQGENPVSLLIISWVGAGKSDLTRHYPDTCVDSVLYVTDITAFAIHKKYGKKLRSGIIRHIVIPDLLVPLNKQKDQADHFITFVNGIIEEGIAKVISRESDFQVDYPVRCGLITTLAREELAKRKDRWAAVGFLSRMIPISYSYKEDSIQAIRDSIKRREYRSDIPQPLNLPKETYIELPGYIAELIEPIATSVKDPSDRYGFRRMKQLQTLAMGHALKEGRKEVTADDLDWLEKVSRFMNYECKEKI